MKTFPYHIICWLNRFKAKEKKDNFATWCMNALFAKHIYRCIVTFLYYLNSLCLNIIRTTDKLRNLSQEANCYSIKKKSTYGTWKFRMSVQKSLPLVPILSQRYGLHHTLMIYFNIVISSIVRSSNWSLSFRNYKIVYTFCISAMCVTSPTNLILLGLTTLAKKINYKT
jgi:hypothetical protein